MVIEVSYMYTVSKQYIYIYIYCDMTIDNYIYIYIADLTLGSPAWLHTPSSDVSDQLRFSL